MVIADSGYGDRYPFYDRRDSFSDATAEENDAKTYLGGQGF